jgi:hypothetical protein
MPKLLSVVALLIGLLGLAWPTPASADAIDGHWCYRTGALQLTIEGPQIVTPGGTKMSGDYDRHGFEYTVPAGEPGAGSKIIMNSIDDETMTLVRASGAFETWTRCPAATS